MTKLSVNINKFATLRNARGHDNPNLLQVVMDVQRMGADGVTVHPRPDERHIRYNDVRSIKPLITTEFNIEGNCRESKFVDLVLETKPTQVTLVPDAEGQLTSDHGWDTIQHQEYLKQMVALFKKEGIRTSLFCDPVEDFIKAAADTGTDRIELYTEAYASAYANSKCLHVQDKATLHSYHIAAQKASELGLEINAGHDLDMHNLKHFLQNVHHVQEVSIGHALICDALYLGLENTIQIYKRECFV
jgi:pyridoxine 5-phosphate synthase